MQERGGKLPAVNVSGETTDFLSRLEAHRFTRGDAFAIDLNGLRCGVVSHPRHVQEVLVSGRYPDKGPIYNGIRRVIGGGITTKSGQEWRSTRRVMAPAFRHEYVNEMIGTIAATGQAYVEDLRERAGDGTPIDVQKEMADLTLRTLTATMFGPNGETVNELSYAVLRDTFTLASKRDPSTVTKDEWQKHESNAALLNATAEDMITGSRNAEPDGTLLSMLAHAKDETGAYLSDATLKDELVNLIFAGEATTGVALMWFFKSLQEHPEIAKRVTHEVRSTLANRTPTAEDIPKLAYTRRVLDETMRLRPPIPFIARAVPEERAIGPLRLSAGDAIMVYMYGTHRHPDFWSQPEQFNPDRFLPVKISARDRWAYLPFAIGNRLCIGKEFALAELAIHTALLIQNFDWEVSPEPVRPHARITLQASIPICAQLRPVSN